MAATQLIPLSVPNLGNLEMEYVTKAVRDGWVSTAGSFIADFESSLATYVGVENAVACQSGTAGLHLALQACGIQLGDAVFAPTLTFIAAVNPIHYIGAHPILMDCDDSLCLDAEKLRSFCETQCDFDGFRLFTKDGSHPVTAIVCVHIFGNLANLEAIVPLCEQYNLRLIEDATEALGSQYLEGPFAGCFAGTVGDAGVYSFNGNKIITTGGGGMIVSRRAEVLGRCRHLSTQAKTDLIYFDHDEIGFNYRMTNIQAALGLAQLSRLDSFIAHKKSNYIKYLHAGLELLPFRTDIRPNYWFYSLLTSHRDDLMFFLAEHQVQARPIWKLIHLLRPYQNVRIYEIERAPIWYEKVVNIPCSSNLEHADLACVISLIKQFELKEGVTF